jgi:hypothetical protein
VCAKSPLAEKVPPFCAHARQSAPKSARLRRLSRRVLDKCLTHRDGAVRGCARAGSGEKGSQKRRNLGKACQKRREEVSACG